MVELRESHCAADKSELRDKTDRDGTKKEMIKK